MLASSDGASTYTTPVYVRVCVRVREQISQVHPVTRRHRPETLSIFIRAPRLPRRVDGSEDAGSMRSAGRDVKTLGDTH